MLCSRFCQWSNETAVTVSSCPQNKSEMEERARIKNCNVTAGIQNCTDTENFKYHCVMNELETNFVELCAPQYYIHGTSIRKRPSPRHCKIKLQRRIITLFIAYYIIYLFLFVYLQDTVQSITL